MTHPPNPPKATHEEIAQQTATTINDMVLDDPSYLSADEKRKMAYTIKNALDNLAADKDAEWKAAIDALDNERLRTIKDLQASLSLAVEALNKMGFAGMEVIGCKDCSRNADYRDEALKELEETQ